MDLKIEKLENRHYRFLEEKFNLSKEEFLDLVIQNNEDMDDLFNEIAIWSEASKEADEILDALVENFDDRD